MKTMLLVLLTCLAAMCSAVQLTNMLEPETTSLQTVCPADPCCCQTKQSHA